MFESLTTALNNGQVISTVTTHMAQTRKAQTRLQFTPIPSSSPSKKEYPDSVEERLANVRSDSARRRHLRKRELTSIPTPEPSSQPQSEALEGQGSAAVSQNEEYDDVQPPAAKRRRPSSNRPRQTTLTPRRSSRLQDQTSSLTRPTSSASLSSSNSQRLYSVEIPSPTPTRRTRSLRVERASFQSSPPPRISTAFSDLGSPETSGDDDDDVIATKPAIQRQRQRQALIVKDDFVVPDEENAVPFTDDDEASIIPVEQRESILSNQTPRSRRLKSRREQQEIQEDLEDLQDSDSPQVQSSRTRGAPVNKERERRRKYIELLKRRRAGEKEPINLDPSDEEEPQEIHYTANYTPNPSAAIFERGRKAHSERSSSEEAQMTQDPNLDIDEDDFVVPDEEDISQGLLGRPHPDIPLEFTSYASAKPRDLFVHVIEWLVKNKISPAFSRHDPLWKLAFSKIEDEVNAQAGSRLKSSSWTRPFTIALNARPGLTTTEALSAKDFLRTCDACNRTNHPAKYEFVFSGSAYHHDSLDPVELDSASEAEVEPDNEHDASSFDSRGHTLPNLATHFFLGRYCAANAELAHRFTHWKYNLNDEVMRHLESQGVLSAEEIVRRERSKGGQRKREREAEEIVDRMKDTGVIEELWKGFKADLEDARIGMEGHERKGGGEVRGLGV